MRVPAQLLSGFSRTRRSPARPDCYYCGPGGQRVPQASYASKAIRSGDIWPGSNPALESPEKVVMTSRWSSHTSTIMSAQYRFSLIQVLGLFTPAMGVIVIVMACLATPYWIFGSGVFGPRFADQSGNPGASFAGITPDAALCFILCGIALWVLRESRLKSVKGAHLKSPAEKFLLEAALVRASLVKVPDENEAGDGAREGALPQRCETELDVIERKAAAAAARGYSRRLARLCATLTAVIAVAALAGY